MNSSPALTLIPRDAGALSGEILADGVKCPVDNSPAVNEIARMADYDSFRHNPRPVRPLSLGYDCKVIPFRQRDLPDMSNVIAANFGRPDTTPPAAPAAAMPRAA